MSYFRPKTDIKTSFISDEKKGPKEKKKRTPLKKSKVKIKKHSETSLRSLLNAARVVFQKWIRKRDWLCNCIACNGRFIPTFQAAHYFKAELYPGLIFNEDNVHACCVTCNVYEDGNLLGYRKGIEARIGKERLNQLIKDSMPARNKKYTREELNDIIKKYSLKG